MAQDGEVAPLLQPPPVGIAHFLACHFGAVADAVIEARKGQEIYWIKLYHKGKEYRTSAKTNSKREAEKRLAHYMGQVVAGTFKGFRNDRITTKEMLDDLVADCTRRQLRSLDTIIHPLKPIRKFFERIDPTMITARDIDLYKKGRYVEALKPATINRGLTYLIQALRLAHEKELLERVPRIKKEPEDNARQGFFEHTEFERVVSFLPDDLKDFGLFAYYAGWRR